MQGEAAKVGERGPGGAGRVQGCMGSLQVVQRVPGSALSRPGALAARSGIAACRRLFRALVETEGVCCVSRSIQATCKANIRL